MSDAIEQAERRVQKLLAEMTTKPFLSSENEITKNSSKQENLSNNLKDAFRILTELYIRKNEWSKFFSLVDLIEQILSKSAETETPNVTSVYHLDDLLRLIADVFYSVSYRPLAFEYYRKSFRYSNETNLFALESVENLIDECMERWHYRMINDSVRNRAYSMAIFKRLEKLRLESASREIRILDIGSGTGLLSALCLSNSSNFGVKNIRIYACEENEFFQQICLKFLKSIDKSGKFINLPKKYKNK